MTPHLESAATTPLITRRMLTIELIIVMWLSLGAAAIRSILEFVNRLTQNIPLNEQTVSIITVKAPGRAWLEVLYQVSAVTITLGAVALVWYLLRSSGEGFATIGVDLSEPKRDLVRGFALAAIIGSTGLVLYLVAVHLGANARVAPAATGDQWFEIPLLLAHAAEAAALEEIVVLGYLIHRLMQIGVSYWWIIAISATLRGSYHLYQGVGGFVGNLIMGAIFAYLFLRWKRAAPMIVAHFLIDAVTFVGYVLLAGHLGWLPT